MRKHDIIHKIEVYYNISQRRQRQAERRPRVACAKIFTKCTCSFEDYEDMLADRQTDRQTHTEIDMLITLLRQQTVRQL